MSLGIAYECLHKPSTRCIYINIIFTESTIRSRYIDQNDILSLLALWLSNFCTILSSSMIDYIALCVYESRRRIDV